MKSRSYSFQKRRKLLGYLYALPCIIIFLSFVIYPLLYGLRTSLFKWDWVAGADKIQFVGLMNYVSAFKDFYFWNSVKNTLAFAAASLLIEFSLGLGCALLLYSIKRGSFMYRTLLIFPLTISDMVAAIMWRMMLDPSSGVMNQILGFFHLPAVNWLGSKSVVILSLVLVESWWMTGNITLIMLSGMQSISKDILEMAKIDGASAWQIFRYIMWPHLLPFTEVAVTLRMVDLLRVFALSWGITGGGPVRASEVSQLYIYTVGLGKYLNIGYSIAMAILFCIIVVAAVGLLKKLIRIGGER